MPIPKAMVAQISLTSPVYDINKRHITVERKLTVNAVMTDMSQQ